MAMQDHAPHHSVLLFPDNFFLSTHAAGSGVTVPQDCGDRSATAIDILLSKPTTSYPGQKRLPCLAREREDNKSRASPRPKHFFFSTPRISQLCCKASLPHQQDLSQL